MHDFQAVLTGPAVYFVMADNYSDRFAMVIAKSREDALRKLQDQLAGEPAHVLFGLQRGMTKSKDLKKQLEAQWQHLSLMGDFLAFDDGIAGWVNSLASQAVR